MTTSQMKCTSLTCLLLDRAQSNPPALCQPRRPPPKTLADPANCLHRHWRIGRSWPKGEVQAQHQAEASLDTMHKGKLTCKAALLQPSIAIMMMRLQPHLLQTTTMLALRSVLRCLLSTPLLTLDQRQARSRFARVPGTRGIPNAYRHEDTTVRNVPLYGDPDDDDSEEVDYEDDYFTM